MSQAQLSKSPSFPLSPPASETKHGSNQAFAHTVSPSSITKNAVPQTQHQRTPTSSSKRNSLFGLRSRSSTTSTAPSSPGQGGTFTLAEDDSRTSSNSVRRLFDGSPTSMDRPQSRASSLFSRTKKLPRQGSKLSLITWDGSDSWFDEKKERMDSDHVPARDKLKRAISAPFNFQHVAHSQRKQFANLERTSQNELIAEYWAVRAAQRPRPVLQGIRAADLYSSAVAAKVPKATASFHETPPLEPMFPPMLSPELAQESVGTQAPSFPDSMENQSKLRSAASFSQPLVLGLSQKNTISTPPRTSSLGERRSNRLTTPSSHNPRVNHGAHASATTGSMTATRPAKKSFRTVNLAITLSNSDIAQAITTADETARQLRTPLSPAYSTDLEDVPEEGESYFGERKLTSRQRHVSAPALQRFQPSPPATPHGKRSRPSSQVSDTLGSPFASPSPRPISSDATAFNEAPATSRGFDTSWYDDIDYCYENAAEASCDFQWSTNAKDTDTALGDELIIQPNNSRPASSLHGRRKPEELSPALSGDSANSEQSQVKPNRKENSPVETLRSQDGDSDLESQWVQPAPRHSDVAVTPLATSTQSPSSIRPGDTDSLHESGGLSVNPSVPSTEDRKNETVNDTVDKEVHADSEDHGHSMNEGQSNFFSQRQSSSSERNVTIPRPLERLGSEQNFLNSRALGSMRRSAGSSSQEAGSRRGLEDSGHVVDTLSQQIDPMVRLNEPSPRGGLQNDRVAGLSPDAARMSTPPEERHCEDVGQPLRSPSSPPARTLSPTAIPLTPPPKSRPRTARVSSKAALRQRSNSAYDRMLVPAPLSSSSRSSPIAST